MSTSLATKYRPKTLEEVFGQDSTVKILQRQLEKKSYTNCYLFCGPSGTGKTTSARAFASAINNNQGSPIEIDAASNSGVENIRTIISSANERAVDCEYKIFIIDEAHAITSTAWQAFLKCIEEPPKYTIFMFCTTNPDKIPDTIKNRVMRFNLSKVDTSKIRSRLEYICNQEHFRNYEEACDYIAKLADGGVRDGISLLEKCANYDEDLSIDNVLKCLGNFSYSKMFELTNNIIDSKEAAVINTIEEFYNSGYDLKIFVETYLDFVLDLDKYALLQTMSVVKVPQSMEKDMKYATAIGQTQDEACRYFNKLVNKILEIKIQTKYDNNVRTTVEAMFLALCRGF